MTSHPNDSSQVANGSLLVPLNNDDNNVAVDLATPTAERPSHGPGTPHRHTPVLPASFAGVGGHSAASSKSTGPDTDERLTADIDDGFGDVNDVQLPSLGASPNDGLHPATVPIVTPALTVGDPTHFLFGQRVDFSWSSVSPPMSEAAASASFGGEADFQAIIARFTPYDTIGLVGSLTFGGSSHQASSFAGLSWAQLPASDPRDTTPAMGNEGDGRDAAARLVAQHDVWTAAYVEAPCPRFGHVAVALDHERVLVHGGRDQSTYLADLWVYNCTTGSWREVTPEAGNEWPSGRSGHTATTFADGTIYFYGGAVTHENTTTELWALNPRSWKWTMVDSGAPSAVGFDLANAGGAIGVALATQSTQQPPASPSGPARPRNRKGHTAVHIAGVMYVYGGATQDNVADSHVWQWTPAKGWDVLLTPQQAPPVPRKYHVAAATSDGKMVIFGGQEVIPLPADIAGAAAHQAVLAAPCLSDVIVFDPIACKWYHVDCHGHVPTPRMCCTAILRGEFLAIFDGANAAGVQSPSCYELHLRTGTWAKAPPEVHPRVQGANRGVSVRCGHTIFHFGGHAGRAFTREVVQLQLRPPLLSDCTKRWLTRCPTKASTLMGRCIADMIAFAAANEFIAT